MTGDSPSREWAAEDHDSVVRLVQRLVRIPSRGGTDSYRPVLDAVHGWFEDRKVPARFLVDPGGPVGLASDIVGAYPGPRYVLDACIDTAPFGDPSLWRYPPTSGVIEDGWLYGRGAADSKAAVAIFAHIAARLSRQRDALHGSLTVLFDADEHTGRFGGAKEYFTGPDAPDDVAGVMVGYPGYDHLVVGGRGFLRARLCVPGRSAHTGSARTDRYDNAVEKAAQLVSALAAHRVPGPVDAHLGLAPRLTVTAIHGGDGFSVVPDRCIVNVDVRLTSDLRAEQAERLIRDIVRSQDGTTVEFEESWPAYRLGEAAPIRFALLEAAQRYLSEPPQSRIAGPSNIGNFLAGLGIDATAGFGVGYQNLHGTDERIDLRTIPMIQATYHDTVLTLLSGRQGSRR